MELAELQLALRLAAGALRQGELAGHAAFGEAVVGQHADAAVDLHGEVLGVGRVKACSGEGGIQSGIGSVHAVKTGSLGVGLGGSGTAEPGINGGIQHGDDFLCREHSTADAAVAALGQAVGGLGGRRIIKKKKETEESQKDMDTVPKEPEATPEGQLEAEEETTEQNSIGEPEVSEDSEIE